MTKSLILALLSIALLPVGKVDAVSLWMKDEQQKGLFVGKRAYAVGDLITIDASESSSLAASQNSVATDSLRLKRRQAVPLANSGMGKHNGGLPGTEIETKSSNKGGGSIANTQDLKGRVSVVVIDTLPNGVLVLEGLT